jgi:4-amino-4-deoxy-L-arabinose transferase-like glycosyltransferase
MPLPSRLRSKSNLLATIGLAILLVAASVPRVVALGRVPLGLNQDEACNGYDAYSLLETGRDQAGNRLPLTIQALNDYRMPLFDYSLVPLVGVFGLNTASVRLGAALWGIADLVALALLGWLMFGMRGSAIAVVLAALSPWHLPLSRFGTEVISAAATTSWAMVCFLLWRRRRWSGWLILSALFFGVSLYSYSVTKLFVPVWIIVLAIFYRRDLRQHLKTAVAAASIIVLYALPEMLLLWSNGRRVQARFNQISIFRADGWTLRTLWDFFRNLISHFSPGYLFIHGQRVERAETFHPPGFGQLLAVQAVMVVLALCALCDRRYRKPVLLLLAWLVAAALPVALTLPSPQALRNVLAITPWTLLSALGMVFLLDLEFVPALARQVAVGVLLIATLWQGASFLRFYFGPYPTMAARVYQYGMEQVVNAIETFSRGDDEPVIITQRVWQPYIYVLFYRRYPPAQFQSLGVRNNRGLFAKVGGFDRYSFQDPVEPFVRLPHGIFVFSSQERPPQTPTLTIRYPDGQIAYQVLAK